MEHDWPPTMRQRRARRQPRPLQGEITLPSDEEPRIHRVEFTVHRQQRRQQVSPWIIGFVIIAAIAFWFPLGTVIAIVMISILLTEHPTIAIAIGGTIALVIGIGIRERWHHRPF